MAHTAWHDMKQSRPLTEEGQRTYKHLSLALEVAEQVRELRTRMNLNQQQLAALVGTSQSMIARLESGGQPPSLRTLERLAEALHADLSVRFVARVS